MSLLLAFALTLLLAVLLSELAERSVLSAAVLFLAAGYLVGRGGLGIASLQADSPVISRLADLALFSVLFTDGMKLSLRDVLWKWHLPVRALALGLPLTLLATAAAAHYVAGLPWLESLLIGAVLSPTDPVFAAAIVGREEIPRPVRHLLNVESGLNDGLALPIVVTLIGVLGHADLKPLEMFSKLIGGVAVGIAIPWAAARLEQSRIFAVAKRYEPLFAFSIGVVVFALTSLLHANEYLAAFAAGITLATVRPELRDEFEGFGEHVTELLKLAALLVFGALISVELFRAVEWTGVAFAAFTLIVARPLAIALVLLGTQMNWHQRLVAAWFGPKGFASVIYGIMVLRAQLAHADEMFRLIALVIIGSMVAHSSTDVLIAKRFCRPKTEDASASSTIG